MSWLLFLDESGHDHKSMPYEVRGGVALHAAQVWPFVQGVMRLEVEAFGCRPADYGKEHKGHKLIDKDRFTWSTQDELLADDVRRASAKAFFDRGARKIAPSRREFTAYGQACLAMARGIFDLLQSHGAVLFAAALPRGFARPEGPEPEVLRKDQIFLLERFFYWLERKQEHGLLVFDEVEKQADRRFIERIQRYFLRTQQGRDRAQWIVPAPLFVSSDLVTPIQAADLCIYAVNCGFRLPFAGMDADVRREVAAEFGPWIDRLQFRGDGYRDGQVFKSFGIVYVPNPWNVRH